MTLFQNYYFLNLKEISNFVFYTKLTHTHQKYYYYYYLKINKGKIKGPLTPTPQFECERVSDPIPYS